MTSLERKLEKQNSIDHRKEKHTTREKGCTSSDSENCDSKTEKSEASCKVENLKSKNAQALNKTSRDLNQPIQFKEGNTEVDSIIYHSDINKAVSLNKKLNKIENDQLLPKYYQ